MSMMGDFIMIKKRYPWFLGFILIGLFSSLPLERVEAQPKPKTNPPVITHSNMIEQGRYGTVLKIYLEANDPDNDMARIAVVVEQVGYGPYPTDWVYLKPEFSGRFIGYLQWNTFSSNTDGLTEWTRITVKTSVFDKAGNESNVAVFPFTFASGVISYPPPPPPFDAPDLPRLGYVNVNLFDPTRDGSHEPPIP